MEEKIYYVEWRYFKSPNIEREIIRTSWSPVSIIRTIDSDFDDPIVYLYFEDITNQPIEDFEEKVRAGYEL